MNFLDNLFQEDYGIHGYIIVMKLIKLLIEKNMITIEEADKLMEIPEPEKK